VCREKSNRFAIRPADVFKVAAHRRHCKIKLSLMAAYRLELVSLVFLDGVTGSVRLKKEGL